MGRPQLVLNFDPAAKAAYLDAVADAPFKALVRLSAMIAVSEGQDRKAVAAEAKITRPAAPGVDSSFQPGQHAGSGHPGEKDRSPAQAAETSGQPRFRANPVRLPRPRIVAGFLL